MLTPRMKNKAMDQYPIALEKRTPPRPSDERCYVDADDKRPDPLDFFASICLIESELSFPSSSRSRQTSSTNPSPVPTKAPFHNVHVPPSSARPSTNVFAQPTQPPHWHIRAAVVTPPKQKLPMNSPKYEKLVLPVTQTHPSRRIKPSDYFWMTRFNELIDFCHLHGHCDVPHRYAPNPKLGGWVQRQRVQKDKIPKNRLDALNGIGFSWALEKKIRKINNAGINTYDELWEFRLNQLISFKALNGHCNVPCRYLKDPQLGRWVQNQREFQKKRTLSDERRMRLENLGFSWTMTGARRGKSTNVL